MQRRLAKEAKEEEKLRKNAEKVHGPACYLCDFVAASLPTVCGHWPALHGVAFSM